MLKRMSLLAGIASVLAFTLTTGSARKKPSITGLPRLAEW
jgi:hypothetical protein